MTQTDAEITMHAKMDIYTRQDEVLRCCQPNNKIFNLKVNGSCIMFVFAFC